MIYFISCHEYVKIGFAVDVNERLPILQIGNPYKLELIRIIDPGRLWQEKWLQAYFKKYRLRGEWYHYQPEMLTITPPEDKPAKPLTARQIREMGSPVPLEF